MPSVEILGDIQALMHPIKLPHKTKTAGAGERCAWCRASVSARTKAAAMAAFDDHVAYAHPEANERHD